MKNFFLHLFAPQESNNHRAKILHHSSLFLTIIFLLIASFFINQVKATFPSILGIQANISIEELLSLTNQKRQENGITQLSFNEELTDAAARKAEDMLEHDYWAHNSPTGKTPWVFIKGAGYDYVYAGENLAKGFPNAKEVVDAWMASPNHRANMLSPNYKDVGFAVKVGELNGEETILVVEEFGGQYFAVTSQAVATSSDKNVETQPAMEFEKSTSVNNSPLIDSSFLAANANILIISLFILVLLLDMIIIEKKKIVRFVGHNIDHIFYLLLILSLVGIFS